MASGESSPRGADRGVSVISGTDTSGTASALSAASRVWRIQEQPEALRATERELLAVHDERSRDLVRGHLHPTHHPRPVRPFDSQGFMLPGWPGAGGRIRNTSEFKSPDIHCWSCVK